MFEIRFSSDAHEVSARFLARSHAAKEATRAALKTIGDLLYREITDVALMGEVVESRTGNLRASIEAPVVTETERGATVTVRQNDHRAPYGPILEQGVDHGWVIYPRDPRGVLAFEVGGQTVFAKYVFHPGLKPRPFMASSLAKMKATIYAEIDRAFGQAVR